MNFTITKEQYQIIRAGLLELPAKVSHQLINDLDVQYAKNLGINIPEVKTEGEKNGK